MKYLYIILFIILLNSVNGFDDIELCSYNQDVLKIPCVLLTPDQYENCSNLKLQVYYKLNSLGNFDTYEYDDTKRCYYNFTYDNLGIYSINYTDGLTAQINLQGGKMQFYNLTTFIVMFGFGLILIFLMHYFDNRFAVSISLGSFASVFFYIMAAMIFLGFEPLYSSISFNGITVNHFLGLFTVIIGLYSTIFCVNINDYYKIKKDDYGQIYMGYK